jgi:two-component system chemotaxis response regulator CheV
MSTAIASQTDILLEACNKEVEFIEFFIAGVSYGINVAKVQRVVAFREVEVTRRVNSQNGVLGIIYNHGKPINLIDLRSALSIEGETADTSRQLVLVTNFNRVTTGYLIDGIQKIYRTSWENYKPLESVGSSQAAGYATGTISIEDRLVLILDLERLMLDYHAQGGLGSDGENAAPESAGGGVSRDQRSDVKVVYAEDSAAIRALTMRTLADSGYTNVKGFANGRDALDYLEKCRDESAREGSSFRDFVDIILTDIEMPRMDGLTLCKQVKSERNSSDIPAVMVYSSLINQEMSEKCRSVGADAQMSKPHGQEIVATIDRLCLSSEVS